MPRFIPIFVAVIATLLVPLAGFAAPLREVHVLAGSVHTTMKLRRDRLGPVTAKARSSGQSVVPPRHPFAPKDRVLWLVAADRRTRVQFLEGVEVDRRTFDLRSGVELPPPAHLFLPPWLSGRRPPPVEVEAPPPVWDLGSAAAEPNRGSPEPPRPSSSSASAYGAESSADEDPITGSLGEADPVEDGEAFVGEAVSAEDLFGEDLDGLLPANSEKPGPLQIHGYVETLLMFGENGPSPHVLDTGLNGMRGLETKEAVLHLDADLGSKVHFFGQVRAVRFRNFDFRIGMLQLGDPSRQHWTIGRQVSPFGTFPVRNLSDQNPLYGYPLSNFYRSSIRPDQNYANIAGLLAARGTGGGGRGMGTVGPALYQTYALYHSPIGRKGKITFGLQNGAQSNSENITVNDRFGVIGRASFAPNPAWNFGVSASIAPYMQANATGLAAGEDANDFNQNLIGVDGEFARNKWRLMGEMMWNEFEVSQNLATGDLGSLGWYVEAKYAASPRWFFASRLSAIDYEAVSDGLGGSTSWDHDVDRLEIGVGYRPTINVLAKLSGQKNETETSPEPDDNVLVAQLIGSF